VVANPKLIKTPRITFFKLPHFLIQNSFTLAGTGAVGVDGPY
jgi:hypothetical protein